MKLDPRMSHHLTVWDFGHSHAECKCMDMSVGVPATLWFLFFRLYTGKIDEHLSYKTPLKWCIHFGCPQGIFNPAMVCYFYSHLISGPLAVCMSRGKSLFLPTDGKRAIDQRTKGWYFESTVWPSVYSGCFFFFMCAFIQIINNIIYKNATLEHAVTYSLQRTRRRACNETHQHENAKMSQQTQSNRPLRTLK